MRAVRLNACLVIAVLLLTTTLCVGGGKSKSAILIVSRSGNAAEESVAKTLARSVFAFLEKMGLVKEVPILLYHFENPEERDHCTSALQIGLGDLPCGALVEVDSHGIPIRVRTKFPHVVDTETVASSIVSSLGGDSSRPTAVPSTDSPATASSATPRRTGERVPMRPDAGIRPHFGVVCNSRGKPPLVGCRVDEIMRGGIAALAGLKVGDIVLRIGSTPVDSTGEIFAVLRQMTNHEETSITVIRDGKETSFKHVFQPPSQIKDFEIVEGKGLPGCVEIGEYRHTIVDRLGSPDNSTEDEVGGTWAYYRALGIQVHFNTVSRAIGVQFGWPFVGQTRKGVPTDGRMDDISAAYGPSYKDTKLGTSNRLISYGNLGTVFMLDSGDEIVAVAVFVPSSQK